MGRGSTMREPCASRSKASQLTVSDLMRRGDELRDATVVVVDTIDVVRIEDTLVWQRVVAVRRIVRQSIRSANMSTRFSPTVVFVSVLDDLIYPVIGAMERIDGQTFRYGLSTTVVATAQTLRQQRTLVLQHFLRTTYDFELAPCASIWISFVCSASIER